MVGERTETAETFTTLPLIGSAAGVWGDAAARTTPPAPKGRDSGDGAHTVCPTVTVAGALGAVGNKMSTTAIAFGLAAPASLSFAVFTLLLKEATEGECGVGGGEAARLRDDPLREAVEGCCWCWCGADTCRRL